MALDFRQIRYLTTVNRMGSFSRAAEALRISQPTLSRSIANFESEYGARIFDRTPQGVTSTSLGKPILAELEALLNQAARVEEQIRRRIFGSAGSVAFGVGPMMAGLLPSVLADVTNSNPDVEMKVEIEPADVLLDLLKTEKIEFCIFDQDLSKNRLDIEVTNIGTLPLGLIARKNHPIFQIKEVTNSDISRYPIISGSYPQKWNLNPRSYLIPKLRTTCNNFHILEEIIENSNALCLTSPALISKNRSKNFKIVKFKEWKNATTSISLITNKFRLISPISLDIIEKISSYIINLK